MRWNRSGRNITAGNTVFNQDFKEYIKSLNEKKVRYLIVGGYAIALHGYPRYTKDIDIWIELHSENVAIVIKALDQFGFGSLGLQVEDFFRSRSNYPIRVSTNRLDLITSMPGVDFEGCCIKLVAQVVVSEDNPPR